MKKIVPVWMLILCSGSAFATCPRIEGKYTYTCTLKKDQYSEFADVLETDGKMLVQQKGCESYTFHNLDTQREDTLELSDIDTPDHRSIARIGKSNAEMIRFRIIERSNLSAWVTKVKIRDKRRGFTLKGRENSRALGFLVYHHTKFNCQFTKVN